MSSRTASTYRDSARTPDAVGPHPERALLSVPARFDVVRLDADPLLRSRIEGFGGRIDEAWSSALRATVEHVAITASVIAWRRAGNLLDRRAHTHGSVRAFALAGLADLVITPRGLWSRVWSSRSRADAGLRESEAELRAAFSVASADPARELGSEAARALLAMRSILIRLSVRSGIVEIEWHASSFDEHAVLPSAVLVLALAFARAPLA